MTDVQSFLKGLPLFQQVRADSLGRLLQFSQERTYQPGETIIGFGRPGEVFGVLLEGEAAVTRGEGEGARRLAAFTPGAYFGEMSLLTGEPTTANVVASTACRVLLVPQETLSVELPLNPDLLRQLARTLTTRLQSRETDENEQEAVEGARRDARKTRTFRPTSELSVSRILVLNLGSSSLKYDLFDSGRKDLVFRGLIERIGLGNAVHKAQRAAGKLTLDLQAPDHGAALKHLVEELTHPERGAVKALSELTAIGHRVVHGGDQYSAPVVIDDAVIEAVKQNASLAPLHNPVNLAGIELCRVLMPGVPQVAVFDTAFHQTMPKHAYLYALPYKYFEDHKLRRYGFHGTSHKYVSLKAASHLQQSSRSLRIITCHLGNGASLAAIDHGRVIDTTMGLTPLEGLVMGTRCGDIDPGLVLHLSNALGLSSKDVDRILNKESGLLGISGISNDMREIVDAAEKGNPRALLAIQMYCYRIKKYIGGYVAALGGLDAMVFTAGVGENSAWIRSRVCQGLGHLGIAIDEEKNRSARPPAGGAADVGEEGRPVRVLVVPTDEEGMIAQETAAALGQSRLAEAVKPETIPIPIGISAHHVHLQKDHVEALFGPGHTLTFHKELTQPGEFACKEIVDVIGPKGRVDRVRILGPERKQTQVEISRTEEFKLGMDAPIRASGDLADSPGCVLEGPAGRVEIKEGVICALRHVHMNPEDALRLAVRDGDFVRIHKGGERSLIFGDVLIRVNPRFKLEMHVDTDEANAAEMFGDSIGYLDSIQTRRP